MFVLSFDIGLRNLAAAYLRLKEGYEFPPECRVYASDTETPDEFRLRAMVHFLYNGWTLLKWRVMDVTEALEKDVKNVKRLSVISKSIALCDTLQALEDEWFPELTPDTLVVEIQHNANADMRAVCMAVLVFFRRTMPDMQLEGKSGSHKLKVCDALGVPEGTSEPVRKRARPAAAAGAGGGGWRPSGFGPKREKYKDNKHRAVVAMEKLIPREHESLKGIAKTDDLADALLQGLWVLWSHIQPRAPVRRRAKK